MTKKYPPLEIIIGALLLLLLGASALLLAPRRGSQTAAAAPSSLATKVPTVEVPSIPTHYIPDPQAIPPNIHAAETMPQTNVEAVYTPLPQPSLLDPRVAATAYAKECPQDWYRTPEPTIVSHCVSLEMAGLEIVEHSRQTFIAAVPTITAYPSPTWNQTASPTRPTPSSTVPIGRDDLGDRPGSRILPLRSAIDLWHIGTISVTVDTSGSDEISTIWLVSYLGGSLYRGLLFGDSDNPVISRMNASWQCPQPIGDLTITNVTDINGIVSFRSTTGTTGTLNMATSVWQFTSPIITAMPTPVTTATAILVAATVVPAAP